MKERRAMSAHRMTDKVFHEHLACAARVLAEHSNSRQREAALEAEVTCLRASNAALSKALSGLLRYAERNECPHEETHRGGALWTICDGCGREWADDEGGFQPYREPEEFEAARVALAGAQKAGGR